MGAIALTALVWPPAVAAHAIGGTFQLPVPLWLYLAAAAAAVGASFVVTAIVARDPGAGRGYPTWPVPEAIAGVARAVLRVVGVVWWYAAIVVGFVVGDISPLPAVLLWIGIWVGLPIASVLLGNPWPSLSPFRTTFAGLEWLARRLGATRLDAGLPYPAGLRRWPAAVLLGAGVWGELILPNSQTALTVAWLMLGYTVLTLAGMALFGQVAWLRNAELFEVELGWFGRIGPIGRRSRSLELCAGCTEECNPDGCVDCPECAVAADDTEREAFLRPWIVGLTDVRRAGWSDASFIVLALAGVTYDGVRETAFGAWMLDLTFAPSSALIDSIDAALRVARTLNLALVFGVFMLAFATIAWLTRRTADDARRPGLAATAGVYASTLLPIAAGYLIAHDLTLVIQGIVWLPSLIVDPLMSLAPLLDAIPVSVIWYLSVIAIVGGHIAGIVLAHRLALRDSPRRAVLAGLPMVALMIGYTILSLWIIAQPIVIEPGVTPPAAMR